MSLKLRKDQKCVSLNVNFNEKELKSMKNVKASSLNEPTSSHGIIPSSLNELTSCYGILPSSYYLLWIFKVFHVQIPNLKVQIIEQ